MTAIQNPYSGGGGSSLPTPVSVPNGGTGDASFIAYAPVLGGTTSTNGLQSVAALGGAGNPLVSGGAGAVSSFTIGTAPIVTALTDAATILVNAQLGNYFTVTLGASRTMGAPSNPVSGQFIEFEIKQPSSAGPDTVSWTGGAGGYSFGASGAPTLSVTNSLTDVVGFRYSAAVGKWLYQGSQLGYS